MENETFYVADDGEIIIKTGTYEWSDGSIHDKREEFKLDKEEL